MTRCNSLALTVLSLVFNVLAVTLYIPEGQESLFGITITPTSTDVSPASIYTGAAAYDPRTLIPPVPPTDPPANTQFGVQLVNGDIPGLSVRHHGAFLGFSIELSVSNHILGHNGSTLAVPFLNLLANLEARAGRVVVRIGGNSQETAVLVPSLLNGVTIEKDKSKLYNPTQTPPLVFTPEILYMMSNISSLVNVDWFLGIPFNDTTNWRLDVAKYGQAILGNRLLGFQAGNEPDLFVRHQNRPEGYGPISYHAEIKNLLDTMKANGLRTQGQIMAPSVNADWTPENVFDTGFLQEFADSLGVITVEKYPNSNCAAAFNTGEPISQPQDVLPMYLTHATSANLCQQYLNTARIAQEVGKPFMMFETNTASCGGFPGISDAFVGALWGLDYGLTMANSNFTGALWHVGGQNVYYNPFTPPPTNQTAFRQWTVGPMYYATLAMTEIMGRNNQSQVLWLNVNEGNPSTPGYAIYENGTPMKVALFNFLNDPSGAHDLNVTISIGGGGTGQPAGTPPSVRVKYLLADQITTKNNITWAGQSLGANFKSDGRLQGEEKVVTVPCNAVNNTCTVRIPAPGFALVFLNDKAYTNSVPSGDVVTFATTAYTRTINTATIDPEVLATSNGHSGKDRLRVGSTSNESRPNGAVSLKERIVNGLMAFFGVALGAVVVVWL